MRQREQFLQKPIVVCLGALFCCALWGSAFPCIKIGYQWFQIESTDTATQIYFAGWRFFLAGIMTILFGSLLSCRVLLPKKTSLLPVLQLSMLQTVAQYVLFYIALAHTSGVNASIIEGTNVFIAMLVASLLYHQEKLSGRKWLGSLIGFAGVILIQISSAHGGMKMHLLGDGCVLLSTVAYAFSSVYLKRFSKIENPVVLSGYQFTVGGFLMLVVSFAVGGRLEHVTGTGIAMLLYLAFVSAAAYTLWGILLKYNSISKVAVYGFFTPVFGVLLSALFLGETKQAFSLESLAALILVSVGIAIVQTNGRQNRDDKKRTS